MPENQNTIPVAKFGKDHWSTFAYIETRVVDYKGVPDRRHLRIDSHKYPLLAHIAWSKPGEYPTRLKGGEVARNHDDWDCLLDLEAAGLLVNNGTAMNPVFALTKRGQRVAAEIRQHKGAGGSFATFVPTLGALATENE